LETSYRRGGGLREGGGPPFIEKRGASWSNGDKRGGFLGGEKIYRGRGVYAKRLWGREGKSRNEGGRRFIAGKGAKSVFASEKKKNWEGEIVFLVKFERGGRVVGGPRGAGGEIHAGEKGRKESWISLTGRKREKGEKTAAATKRRDKQNCGKIKGGKGPRRQKNVKEKFNGKKSGNKTQKGSEHPTVISVQEKINGKGKNTLSS